MNKSTLALILSLFTVLLLVLTNPNEEQHKSAVKAKAIEYMQRSLKEHATEAESLGLAGKGLAEMLGNFVVDKLIAGSVSRSNYLLFSTTKFIHEGEEKTIGVGILGNVFISSKIDEAIKNAKP